MKYLQTKALKIFKVLIEWELARQVLKYSVYNLMLPHWLRQYALFALTLLPLQTSFSYLKLRCFFSNQSRSVITGFKVNRFRFKYLISKGYITGVHSSTW